MTASSPAIPRHHPIVIVGSGFSGLGAAIRLKQEGIDDFVILERADDLGGTWRDNAYPGCACDVRSHLYSFSFAPNPAWSRMFSPQPEILEYLRGCATRFGVDPHIRYGHEVRGASWDVGTRQWRIDTSRGLFTANIVIAAFGALSEPRIPALPGLESFQGRIFHSARWDHQYPLEGRRVAVIGTGASAIQFVPAIQPVVDRLFLFQRTPPWIIPRRDRPLSAGEHRRYRAFPILQRLRRAWIYWTGELLALGFLHPRIMRYFQRLVLGYLEQSVPDPALRAKLTPDYTLGCKRVLLSNDYLPSLTRENVEVVTEGILEVRPHAIVSRDGIERPLDAIIFGTGFYVTDMPFAPHVRGRDGRTLAEVWGSSPRAHLGTTIAGFPNLFLLMGPNTGLGHNSVIFMLEAQLVHILNALRFMRRRGVTTLEPREEVQSAYAAEMDRKTEGTVWVSGGCSSWYLDAAGRNSTLWPGFSWQFRRRVKRFRPEEYVLEE